MEITEPMGLAEMADYYGVPVQTAWNWTKRESFPTHRIELRMGRVWEASEVDFWMRQRQRADGLRQAARQMTA